MARVSENKHEKAAIAPSRLVWLPMKWSTNTAIAGMAAARTTWQHRATVSSTLRLTREYPTTRSDPRIGSCTLRISLLSNSTVITHTIQYRKMRSGSRGTTCVSNHRENPSFAARLEIERRSARSRVLYALYSMPFRKSRPPSGCRIQPFKNDKSCSLTRSIFAICAC